MTESTESTESNESTESIAFLDFPFATGLLPINVREAQEDGTSKTVHKGNVPYGYITLQDVNEGLPAPDELKEVTLPDGEVTVEPFYNDTRLQWVQESITQRMRSIAAGRAKQSLKAVTCWRDLLISATAPKYAALLKECRAAFGQYLESIDLSEKGIEQLTGSFFGGAIIKAAKPELKAKVRSYVDGYMESLDLETKVRYASVLAHVMDDIDYTDEEGTGYEF